MELSGKVALVTGGVNGFGRAVVERFTAEGARVAVLDIDPEGQQKLSDTAPTYRVCDVTDAQAVAEALDSVVAELGQIDVLVNNAGILHSAPLIKFGSGGLETHSVAEWERVISTNLSSVFYVTASAVKHMMSKRTRGVVVNISSISANGNPGQSAYSAAKAGVNALTATWARELGRMGIRVAAVAPGFFDTPSTHRTVQESVIEEVKKRIPLRRLGALDELVDGVCWIVENDFFNGKVLELDGGHTISV